MFNLIPYRKNSINSFGSFDTLIDNFFNDDFFVTSKLSNNFNVDVKETDTSYAISADLPGFKKDSIMINFENNYVTLSAKREDDIETKGSDFIRKERHFGEFKRSFYFSNIKDDDIKASFKDGVLTINLPKEKKDLDTKKRIEIE